MELIGRLLLDSDYVFGISRLGENIRMKMLNLIFPVFSS